MEWTALATSIAASPLFKLPPELRLRIYEYAVYSCEDQLCEVTRKDGIPELALLFTCKTVRAKAIPVFYTVNTFRIAIESYHAAVQVLTARKKAAL